MKSLKQPVNLFFSLLLIATLAACSSAKKSADEATDGSGAGVEDVQDPLSGVQDADVAGQDSDSGRALGLQTVNFPYDSSTLTTDTRQKIVSNVEIMKNISTMRIQIEGHCDQRGGIQYNLALGERRAKATKQYMIDLGVDPNRITVISFGKERLLDPGENEMAYGKNRRANFVITSK